jgi:hypothetical protein
MLAMLLGLLLSQDAVAFYNPSTGRWLNRDPINETGFKLLTGKGGAFDLDEASAVYCFVHNDPISKLDIEGLKSRLRDPWHPPMEGKPCCACARRPCSIKARAVDNGTENGVFRMKAVDAWGREGVDRSGCCPGWELIWSTCSRPPKYPNGGPIDECTGSTECEFRLRGHWMILLHARYLNCENGKWTAHPDEVLSHIQCDVENGKWTCTSIF